MENKTPYVVKPDPNDPNWIHMMKTSHLIIKRLMVHILQDIEAVSLFVQRGGDLMMDPTDIRAIENLENVSRMIKEMAQKNQPKETVSEEQPQDTP